MTEITPPVCRKCKGTLNYIPADKRLVCINCKQNYRIYTALPLKNKSERICVICNKEFNSTAFFTKTCSPECFKIHVAERDRAYKKKTIQNVH